MILDIIEHLLLAKTNQNIVAKLCKRVIDIKLTYAQSNILTHFMVPNISSITELLLVVNICFNIIVKSD